MGFIEFNVWLDTAFVVLWVLVILFLVFHFTMFVVTGRFRKSFLEGHWPEHDSRPPRLPKILHFTHMISIIILALTGMAIRFPVWNRVPMRYTHYVFMIIVTIVLVWSVLYAFFSKKNADWGEFAIRKVDLQSAIGVLKYYGYMSNEKPHVAKYNVLQKMSYNLFLYMMIVQAITGFALVATPIAFGLSPREILVGWWLGALAGSTDLAGWGVRTVHYILNWLFIIMTTVHFYLAMTVDVPCMLDFFGLKRLEVVEGAHGHGAPDTHAAVEAFPASETTF
jgi:Ni,Fe-hydrogenase I cytochrome b subunit